MLRNVVLLFIVLGCCFRSVGEETKSLRDQLKEIVIPIKAYVDYCMKEFDEGKLSEQETRDKVRAFVKNGKCNTFRLGKTIGYFSMSDLSKPFPKMIEHPDIPTGTVMSGKYLNNALPGRKNCMVATIEESEKGDFGHVVFGGGTHWKVNCSFAIKKMGWLIGACVPFPEGELPDEVVEAELQRLKEQLAQTMKHLEHLEKLELRRKELEAQIKLLEGNQKEAE